MYGCICRYGCMDGKATERKGGPIDLDWSKINAADDEPPELVVVPKSPAVSRMEVEEHNQPNMLNTLSDIELDENLKRMRSELPQMEARLKDGGEKYRMLLKRHQAEFDRRELLRAQKIDVDDGCRKNAINLQNQKCIGVSDDVQNRASSAPSSTESRFGSLFCNKLEGKETVTANGFQNELSILNRCNRQKMDSDKQFFPKYRQKRGLSERELPFRSPGSPFLNVDEESQRNGNQKDRSSTSPSVHLSEDMPGLFRTRNIATRGQTSNHLKRMKGETFVLVDEEELEVAETIPKANEVHECKDTKIYYPSRDDPSSVEICYSDMDCLAPEAFLSSTIMNFYIRHLTLKMTERGGYSYHVFNTYFYEKLKKAVMKKNINENSFEKFRRWWKGVNIFEKSYILLPIHDNLHWSLVIICIPDKEDRSGPILLHLDSLKLHCSHSIFSNIKSFLREEWKFLKEGEASLDLPIADTTRRIDEKIIEVPQQRNDYDCGLFVLFFMKRFIEEAPQRLKRKDLVMFGRHWFSPEEASSLRDDIRSLLAEKFKDAVTEENQVLGH